MKKQIKYTFMFTLIAVNLVMIAAMVVCAYSCYISPHTHPNISYLGMAFPGMLIINVLFVPVWLILKRRFTYIPILGLLLCSGAIRSYCPINLFASEDDADLKFISYNVFQMGDSTKKNIPSENPILLYLLEQDADIVCVQEAINIDHGDNLDTLKTKYPYFDRQNTYNNTMAVLSKYPIIDITDLDNDEVRMRTVAYRIKVNEDTVLVLNNHFESFKLHENEKESYEEIIRHPDDKSNEQRIDSLLLKVVDANSARALQVDWLAEYVNHCTEKYIIVCGDFNDNPISYTHHKMTEHLNDSYTRGGNGPGWTYNRSAMYFRIDNILVSENIKTCKSCVDNSIDTSDHYPIISWLKLNK